MTILLTELIYNEPTEWDYFFVFMLLEVFEDEYDEKRIENIYDEIQKDTFDIGLDHLNKQLDPIKIEVDNYNKYMDTHLVKKQLSDFKRTTRSKILNMMLSGNTEELKKYIEDTIENPKIVNRIMRIYRTETTRSRSRMKLDVERELKERGYEVEKIWRHTLSLIPSRIHKGYIPRDSHMALDGTYADKEGLFHTQLGSAEAPGLFGIPEEDINCGCDVDIIAKM